MNFLPKEIEDIIMDYIEQSEICEKYKKVLKSINDIDREIYPVIRYSSLETSVWLLIYYDDDCKQIENDFCVKCGEYYQAEFIEREFGRGLSGCKCPRFMYG